MVRATYVCLRFVWRETGKWRDANWGGIADLIKLVKNVKCWD